MELFSIKIRCTFQLVSTPYFLILFIINLTINNRTTFEYDLQTALPI